MRINVMTTMKNEDDLLRPWIRYHANLVGAENLLVFDNGSTSKKVLKVIDWARRSGVTIDQNYPTEADFVNREDIYTEVIKKIDKRRGADFHFPLDCDEFLAVANDNAISADREALVAELRKYERSDHPLMIHAGLDNNPKYPGHFRWVPEQRKTFFAGGACDWLGGGFHEARSKTGATPVKTNVVYIHFHWKPYATIVEHSRAKLAPWTSDFSTEGLKAHIAEEKVNFHCAYHLLRTEKEYDVILDRLYEAKSVAVPEIEAAFQAIGEALPFAGGGNDDNDAPLARPARRSLRAKISRLFSRKL